MSKVLDNGIVRDATAEEQAEIDARNKSWNDASATRKLAEIRTIRNKLLQDTDWKVTMAKEKGTTLSSGFKTWRDNLRKIPQDYTTETKYNELLARDDNGKLTHSVWSE
tara:strand:+ start:250 stop:576 length:327 start_codon:yes stop_codon:yes gene_type:complete